MGFFAGSEVTRTKAPRPTVPQCGACGLYRDCKSPKMEPTGEGKRRILLLAEAPGKEEDVQGVQFVGKSGRYLSQTLNKFGVSMRRDCWLTNALHCRPKDNRTPTDAEIGYCRPYLDQALNTLDPLIIILMGRPAVHSLLGMFWSGDIGSISRWVGWTIPCQFTNAWVCPTYHPAYVLRSEKGFAATVIRRSFESHIKAAVGYMTEPRDVLPDYNKLVERVFDHKRAAHILRQMIQRGGTVAFDYETNAIKPEGDDRMIVSCAVCWEGKRTIAYPWHGEAIKATRELLRSPLGKIAANLKFEDRWTRKHLNTPVRNWVWDTMVSAHLIDNRRGICNLTFQAYVNFGKIPYDDHIKKFLAARKGVQINSILSEIKLDDLLLYNGIDALLEFELAQKQMRIVKDG